MVPQLLLAAAVGLVSVGPTIPPLPGGGPAPLQAQAVAGGQPLEGTFKLSAGVCGATVGGTYFRMIQPGGTAGGGPFVQNTDSSCADKTYTPLSPGSDGGLVTGGYQAQPDPPFDGTGGGKASRITAPAKFYGVNFATATNPTDPQTGTKVAAPSVTVDGGKLSGDLRAFAAAWNNQHFNQGAPKPDGSTPGTTSGPTGTYDATTGRYTLEWTSQIVGGPFNNFTGKWHFEGTFVAAQSSSPSTSESPSTATTATTAASSSSSSAPARSQAASVTAATPAAPAPSATATAPSGLARTGPTFPAVLGVVALVAALFCGYGLRLLGVRR